MNNPPVEESLDPADWVDGSAALLPYRAASTRLTTETVAFPPGTWDRPPVEVGAFAWPLPGTPLAFVLGVLGVMGLGLGLFYAFVVLAYGLGAHPLALWR